MGRECKILMVEFFNSVGIRMQRDQSSKVKKKLYFQLKAENQLSSGRLVM